MHPTELAEVAPYYTSRRVEGGLRSCFIPFLEEIICGLAFEV